MSNEDKYTSLTLLIELGQEKRIIHTLKSRSACVINIRKSRDNVATATLTPAYSNKLNGNHATRGVLHLSEKHSKRLREAHEGAKVGLKFRRHELDYNRKQHTAGGFIPFLLPLLGAVATGATTSLVENTLSKKGSGLLTPSSSSFSTHRSGGQSKYDIAPPTLLWHKKPPATPANESSDRRQIKKRKRPPDVLRIRPDKHDGDGLRLTPWPTCTQSGHFDMADTDYISHLTQQNIAG